jgi:hypothetical protein
VFDLANVGNAPVWIEGISLDGGACTRHGLTVHNCKTGFELLPNETVELDLSYKPNFTRRTELLDLYITTSTAIYTIPIKINFPLEDKTTLLQSITFDKSTNDYYMAELCLIGVVSGSIAVVLLVIKEARKNQEYRRKLCS